MAKKSKEPERKLFRPDKTIKIAKFARHEDTHVKCVINTFENGVVFFDTRQFKDQLPVKGISIHADHMLTYQRAVNKAVRKMKRLGYIEE